MLPKERILAVLEGKTPDYVPLFPKISYASSQFVPGMSVLEYMTDYHAMAEALLTSAERFAYDAVGITTDIANEGMALGSRYERSKDAPSRLVEHLLESVEEYEKIPMPDPYEVEPCRTILRAAEDLRRQAGDRLFITAWCNGPLNVATQLMPMDELLCSMIADPENLHEVLRRCTAFTCRYAQALVEAGADAVSFGHATASCTVISPASYQEFALPYEKQIVDAIHQAGGAAITHICGNVMSIAELIRQNGSEIIDCDHMCDLSAMLESTGRVIRGNLDPALLANGTPEEVYDAACAALREAKSSGRFILGSGCEVNLGTPAENMQAMAAARMDHGQYEGETE